MYSNNGVLWDAVLNQDTKVTVSLKGILSAEIYGRADVEYLSKKVNGTLLHHVPFFTLSPTCHINRRDSN